MAELQRGVGHSDGGIADVNLVGYLLKPEVEPRDVEPRGFVVGVAFGENTADAVLVGMLQADLHARRHVEVAVVEPSAAGFARAFVGQMVVRRPVQAVEQHFPLPVFLFIDHAADPQTIVHAHAFALLDVHPGRLRPEQFGMDVASPTLLQVHAAEDEMPVVVGHIHVFSLQFIEMERQLLLFLPLFPVFLILFLRGLQRIEHELVVGSRVGPGLEELRPKTLDAHLFQPNLLTEQGPQADLGVQQLQAEHRSALTVLHTQVVEAHVVAEEAEAHAVDLHLRLQFLLQHLRGVDQTTVLHRRSVEQHHGHRHQHDKGNRGHGHDLQCAQEKKAKFLCD